MIRKPRGFTLTELVVTMIVIGILAVVALPRFDLLKGFDEIGYRDKVRGTLEFARKAAVAQRRNVQVTLTGNNLSLNIASDVPEGANANTFDRTLALPTINKDCSAPAANKICPRSPVVLSSGPALITFSPLGVPGGTSNCVVSARQDYCYTVRGDADHIVTVEAETGYVH